MQPLQIFIDQLQKGRNYHISILDVSGVLHTSLTELAHNTLVHSCTFCRIAKSTEHGLRTCLHCKKLANNKAIHRRTPFAGHCAYGLYEVAYPVIISNQVAAVVYVGNFITDSTHSMKRIERTCRSTRVSKELLFQQLHSCEAVISQEEPFAIAELVSDYLKILCKQNPTPLAKTHWLIDQMKTQIENSLSDSLTLTDFSTIYQKNEKYLGRLFKKETGVSYHTYCNQLRIEKAKELLRTTPTKVIDIAFECGFSNIAYFNRVFKKAVGLTPCEYRKTQQ